MPGWQLKSDWTTAPRNPTYQDLQNIMLDQGRAGVSAWGGSVDAGGHSLTNGGLLAMRAHSVTQGLPTLGATTNGSLRVTNVDPNYGVQMGTDVSGNSWMQAQRFDGGAAVYSLLFQPLGGKVGIGMLDPASILHVRSDSGDIRIDTVTPTSDPTFTLARAGVRKWSLYNENGANSLGLYDWSNAAFRMLILPNGNVGFGTSTPAHKVDVNGTLNAGTALYVGGVVFATKNANINYLWTQAGGALRVTNAAASLDLFTLLDNGYAGFGTTIPGAKVQIDGTGTGANACQLVLNEAGTRSWTLGAGSLATGAFTIVNGSTGNAVLLISGSGVLRIAAPAYATNAAAISGGLAAGDIYQVTGTSPRQLAIVF